MNLDSPRAHPIFLTKNYFSKDVALGGGTFSVPSNAALGPRLYDMDPRAYWVSSGSSEGASETVWSQLYEGFSSAARTVHLVALLNINLKAFTLYGSADGGVTWTVLAAVLANTATDYVLDLQSNPASINAFKVVATNTIGAVAEKQIGTIVLCGFLGQVARAPDKILRKFWDSRKIVTLADGSEDVTHVKRSPASQGFHGRDIIFTYLSDIDRDMMMTIRCTTPSFCLYAEPAGRPRDLYFGRFDNDWQDEETALYRGEGNSTTISFKEISS